MADLNDKSLEELEAMMSNPEDVHTVTKQPEAPAEPEVIPSPEPEEPPATTEEPPATESEEPAEPEEDHAAVLRQVEDDRREALLAKLMEHNSRLAGQIGDLRQSISRTPPTEYSAEASDGEVSELRDKIERMEAYQRSEATARAIQDEVRLVLERPYLKGIDPAIIQSVTQKHEEAWHDLETSDDPDLARLNARTVLLTVAAEARRAQLDKSQADSRERKAEQTRKLADSKLKASVSASGSAPGPRAAEKTLADRSVKELEQLLNQMTG